MKKLLISAIIGAQTMMMFSAGASAPSAHKVGKGDSLWKISIQSGVNIKDIFDANSWLTEQGCIRPGQVIIIPGIGSTKPDTNKPSPDEDATLPDEKPTPPTQDVTPPDEDTQTPETNHGIHEFESEVIGLVNEIRASNGLGALAYDADLGRVAKIKSQDMKDKGYFSHTSPTYGSPFDMMKTFGISYRYAAENIAKGQSTPRAVVNAWMNSAGHRKNILNPSYTHIGVGYVSEGHYWTQMFVGR